jgi:hypothetical protein
MRRFFTGLVVTAIACLVSTIALAANQDTADQIAKSMRSGGQLRDYSIEVKYQDGTAWLNGRVRDDQQMAAALKTALATPGVERVVNGLTTSTTETSVVVRSSNDATAARNAGVANRVASSFTNTPSRPVSVMEVEPMYVQTAQQPIARTGSAPMASNAGSAPTRQQRTKAAAYQMQEEPRQMGVQGPPLPMYAQGAPSGVSPVNCDQPAMPNYAWPSYGAYPNYASVTYPRQYSPTAWPYIGPFYPYPQVPLGWRQVTLEWEDGWWFLDFKDKPSAWDSPAGKWY